MYFAKETLAVHSSTYSRDMIAPIPYIFIFRSRPPPATIHDLTIGEGVVPLRTLPLQFPIYYSQYFPYVTI